MKIKFILVSKHGHIGDFHYDWQCPFVPRIGEGVLVVDIFDEGRFVISDLDHIESKVGDVEEFIKDLIWNVTDITWCKNEKYYLVVSLFGE